VKREIIVPCLAICALGGLEAIALFNGVDGALFSSIAVIIGGIGGYSAHKLREKKS